MVRTRAGQIVGTAVGDTGALLDSYISEHAFADEMAVSIRTVRQWRALGEGPAITRVGKRVFYARSDCQAWLRSQRQEVA